MKKYIYISILFIFSFNIFSDNEIFQNDVILEEDLLSFNDTDGCTQFITSMASSSKTVSNRVETNTVSTLSFDLDFSQEREDLYAYRYKRSKDKNLYANYQYSEIEWLQTLEDNEVYEINGIKVASMTDAQVDEALQNPNKNGNITFSVIGFETGKIQSFEIPAYKKDGQLFLSFQLKDIESIDSAKGTYKTRYTLNTSYTLYSVRKFLEEYFNAYIEKIGGGKDLTWNLACEFSEDDFLNAGIWVPDIRETNIISLNNYSRINYQIYAEYDYPKLTDFYVNQRGDHIATFSSPFNFATFPFDKQDILFNFIENDQHNSIYLDDYLDSINYKKLDLYEWKIINFDAQILPSPYSSWERGDPQISYRLSIERNSLYFLTKILVPILIIIGLTFSVMWINSKELESRLTVSVVCFLALITYTFIIDKDLPKLSYLTIMDYIILISYIFAAIPTIQSIYASKYRVYEKALILDRRGRTILPAIYLILIALIIVLSVSSNSEHTNAFFSRFTT
tara:strand:- start:694 stop:2220 length:1527 start_codon:yes stop_codon:yes gene_type:complete